MIATPGLDEFFALIQSIDDLGQVLAGACLITEAQLLIGLAMDEDGLVLPLAARQESGVAVIGGGLSKRRARQQQESYAAKKPLRQTHTKLPSQIRVLADISQK